MKYQHILATQAGGTQVLQLREDELPEPKASEVRVKILAAGVAFPDILIRMGKYPGIPAYPFTPGYDLVGVIEKCGSSVKERTVGQMVAALPQWGSYSQYLCLPEQEVVPVPEQIDPAEAVSLVLNYVTAYQMLYRAAHVKAGERILVHGAAGGVGTALLQLGHLLHLEMYGTASTAKQQVIASLGATPIDYTKEDFATRIHALTGDGVDAVFDAIGGEHFYRSFQALRKGGRFIGYGFTLENLRGGDLLPGVLRTLPKLAYWSILPNGKHAQWYAIAGALIGMKNRHPEWFREDLTKLFALLVEGKIKPVIAKRLSLEDVVYAHELIESAQIQGKLVLLPHISYAHN
ncbi:NADPH:quinone reductase [Ktedonobacter sp. SOSP1-85]|uniref:medium chain dehydrogenase/reductase family protein n=1 Tax=Ktedonobacter sp. SOSP1-85 TaxID=2778367 RepID=UPI001915D59B|nr:medium chain dehydrogenase/reductase family protein [Ktedonobacter sp. SOSP1-85]GHO72648.1 NADPH:quinone reductase [Ktedonobacter sp. SOSP1-85]